MEPDYICISGLYAKYERPVQILDSDGLSGSSVCNAFSRVTHYV